MARKAALSVKAAVAAMPPSLLTVTPTPASIPIPAPPPSAWASRPIASLLQQGEIIRMVPNGPPYRVEMVNESRAYCVPLKGQQRVARVGEGEAEIREFESLGGGVSISPRAIVERIDERDLDESERQRNKRKQEVNQSGETTMATASAIPVAEKSARGREKVRKAALARKRADKHAGLPGTGGKRKLAGAAARSAGTKKKVVKTVRSCACGCGEETMSYFAPGHDGRWHGWMKKIAGGADPAEVIPSKKVRDSYTFKSNGKGGKVPTLDYRGDPYKAKH